MCTDSAVGSVPIETLDVLTRLLHRRVGVDLGGAIPDTALVQAGGVAGGAVGVHALDQ